MRRSIVLAVAVFFATTTAWAEEIKPLHEVILVAAGQTFVFENLAGQVHVSVAADGAVGPAGAFGAAGSVTIDGTVHAENRELLDAVQLDISKDAGRSVAHVRYPVDRTSTFHYPDPHQRDGFWSSFNFSWSSADYQGRHVTITSGRRRGRLLYADVTLYVPKGVSVELRNCVGRVESRDLTGPVTVVTDSADVIVRDSTGRVRIQTGSGDVHLRGETAGVHVTTGSGDVDIAHAAGDVTLETGSGDMHLAGVTGALKVRTGSGSAVLDRVDGPLDFQSGSGDITGRHLTLEGRLAVQSGSGDVNLAGDTARLSEATIHVASGSVNWRMAGAPGLDFTVSTTSGSIDLGIPGLTFRKRKERRVEASTGAGGVPVRISTSSGDVSLRS
jgi:DUF4097 and DUF4098 domain-containing protein YvlB